MSKEEFKARWESDDNGGGITSEDIIKCAELWGIPSHPSISITQYRVLKAAGVVEFDKTNNT